MSDLARIGKGDTPEQLDHMVSVYVDAVSRTCI